VVEQPLIASSTDRLCSNDTVLSAAARAATIRLEELSKKSPRNCANETEGAQMKRKRGRLLTPRDLELFFKLFAALRGDYGEEGRRLVKDFIAAWKLKRKGHKVRRPKHRPGVIDRK
jgi:hypothetical protein